MDVGYSVRFLKDNFSKSNKNVLREIRYQRQPKAQGKLISVPHGELFDVALHICRNSKIFGTGLVCCSRGSISGNCRFQSASSMDLTISNKANVLYKVTQYYDSNYECSVFWHDDYSNIDWSIHDPIQSIRALKAKSFIKADYV